MTFLSCRVLGHSYRLVSDEGDPPGVGWDHFVCRRCGHPYTAEHEPEPRPLWQLGALALAVVGLLYGCVRVIRR